MLETLQLLLSWKRSRLGLWGSFLQGQRVQGSAWQHLDFGRVSRILEQLSRIHLHPHIPGPREWKITSAMNLVGRILLLLILFPICSQISFAGA